MFGQQQLPNVSSKSITNLIRDAKKDAASLQANTAPRLYAEYQHDPVGFVRNELRDTLTPDLERIMLSVRDYPETVARSGNATGKTFIAARIAAWFYKCHPGAQVYTAAAPPLTNLTNLLWGEIGAMFSKHQRLFAGDANTYLRIERNDNEFITGVAIPAAGTPEQREARFSGKHAPYLLFIIDEGDAVPNEVYNGIESCLSGGHGRLLIMFNPRSSVGPVYKKETNREANVVTLSALDHPNVVTGIDSIKGAVTREKTVQRINDWSRPLAPGEEADAKYCFDIPSYLIGTTTTKKTGGEYAPLPAGTRKITDGRLAYMVLARYPAQASNQLISEEWISNAVARWHAYVAKFGERPPSGIKARMGLDVGEFGDDDSAVCLRYGGWVAPYTVWNGVDTLATARKAVDIYMVRNIGFTFVDANGIGAGVPPDIREELKRRKVKGYGNVAVAIKTQEKATKKPEDGEFRILRDQLWWSVREWLRTDPGAMLPPDEELIEELLTPTYEQVGKFIKVEEKKDMKKRLGRSPNRADALCLTFAPDPPTSIFALV